MSEQKKAMSDKERQQKRREKIKSQGLKPLLVKGDNGFYDERIRLALAIKNLFKKDKIPNELIEELIKETETVFETDLINRKYINKRIRSFLNEE